MSMKCLFPDEALKAVISHLRRSGETIVHDGEAYVIKKGRLNTITIKQACSVGAISLTDDGSIQVCGTRIGLRVDTVKLRRKVEDHLRKTASQQDIIRIAACLGINLK